MAGPVNGTGRMTRLALLTAVALTIFMAEAQLPADRKSTRLNSSHIH